MGLYIVDVEYILAEAGRARSILSVQEPRISFSAFSGFKNEHFQT